MSPSVHERVHFGLYVSLLVALVATFGSLYMSDVLGWLPCLWCWYQRILMYPQVLLLAAGIVRRDARIPGYVLLLSVLGILASLWHIGLQKIPQIMLMYPCKGSVPCSSDSLWQIGIFPHWVTVPMLALLAFLLITAMCVAALLGRRSLREDEIEGLPPFVFVTVLVLAVLVLFGAGALAARRATAQPAASITQLNPAGALATSDGAVLFERSCRGCHQSLGSTITYIRPQFISAHSDAELVALVKNGRDVRSPENFSGSTMPAYGGQISLTDAQLAAVVAHLKQIVH
ncbi:MAG: disulfide bond formation protein B [Chloroflexi bacterium]|nr:disulfide bond formation protein B [Chloroflexota bacterium]